MNKVLCYVTLYYSVREFDLVVQFSFKTSPEENIIWADQKRFRNCANHKCMGSQNSSSAPCDVSSAGGKNFVEDGTCRHKSRKWVNVCNKLVLFARSLKESTSDLHPSGRVR